MKKIFTLLFGAVLFLSVAGCADDAPVPQDTLEQEQNAKHIEKRGSVR